MFTFYCMMFYQRHYLLSELFSPSQRCHGVCVTISIYTLVLPIHVHVLCDFTCVVWLMGQLWPFCVNKMTTATTYRLTFNEHIRVCTLEAARQLNSLILSLSFSLSLSLQILRYQIQTCSLLPYYSLVASNLHYYPLVWHLCGITNNSNNKINNKNILLICICNI